MLQRKQFVKKTKKGNVLKASLLCFFPLVEASRDLTATGQLMQAL